MIFVGDDWAEDHHDICVMDDAGKLMARRRVPEGLDGVAQFHAMVADHVEDASEVIVGIETERGMFVSNLIAAGYAVYAINPLSVSRYRDRHAISRAKSDPGDAKLLADLVRTDRHNHRPTSGDSELVDAIKIVARAHQNMIWARQRHTNQVRSALREYFPGALNAFGDDLDHPDAIAVLTKAPTPEQAKALSKTQIIAALKRGGRKRNLDSRAQDIRDQFQVEQLHARALITRAFGAQVHALVKVIATLNQQIDELESELATHFDAHPDAEVIRSLPGLGVILGARMLSELGDDRTRYVDAKSCKNYVGTSPVTKASGTRHAVLARHVHNDRLFDAVMRWSHEAILQSEGARRLYDSYRGPDKQAHTHMQASRKVANRFVGILYGCLKSHKPYSEAKAWPNIKPA